MSYNRLCGKSILAGVLMFACIIVNKADQADQAALISQVFCDELGQFHRDIEWYPISDMDFSIFPDKSSAISTASKAGMKREDFNICEIEIKLSYMVG